MTLTAAMLIIFMPMLLMSETSISSAQPASDLSQNSSMILNSLAEAKAENDGLSAPLNYELAFATFQKVSSAGSLEGKAWLGSMYLRGHGTSRNNDKAVALISEAASGNNPVGLRFLGLLYEEGTVIGQDYSQAMSNYNKAITSGDAPSYGRLGMMYLRGLGTPIDIQKATELFTYGSKSGDVWSKVELGQLYMSVALHQNYVSSRKEFSEAAAMGSRMAAFRLGRLYELGLGGAKDYSSAIQQYRRSSAKGYAPAELSLGRLYEAGLGVRQNAVTAYLLYSLAEGQGAAEAAPLKHAIASRLTPQQRTRIDAGLISSGQRYNAATDLNR